MAAGERPAAEEDGDDADQDGLQPALLVVCLGSAIGVASSTGGAARTLAALAGFGLAVVATPRAGRPAPELPELGTVDGVADLGFALAAWFSDPHHNWIGLLQFKEPVRCLALGHPGSPWRAGRSTATTPAPDRRQVRHPRKGDPVMTGKRLFTLNGVIAGGYGLALLVATGPILDLYGITPNPEGVYMARWFGLELLAIGLMTWLARDATESAGGRAIARALAVTYPIGVVLALWGTLFGPFNTLGWIAVGLNLGWERASSGSCPASRGSPRPRQPEMRPSTPRRYRLPSGCGGPADRHRSVHKPSVGGGAKASGRGTAVCADHGKTQPAPRQRSDDDVSWTPSMKVMLATVAQHPAARSHPWTRRPPATVRPRRTFHTEEPQAWFTGGAGPVGGRAAAVI